MLIESNLLDSPVFYYCKKISCIVRNYSSLKDHKCVLTFIYVSTVFNFALIDQIHNLIVRFDC